MSKHIIPGSSYLKLPKAKFWDRSLFTLAYPVHTGTQSLNGILK